MWHCMVVAAHRIFAVTFSTFQLTWCYQAPSLIYWMGLKDKSVDVLWRKLTNPVAFCFTFLSVEERFNEKGRSECNKDRCIWFDTLRYTFNIVHNSILGFLCNVLWLLFWKNKTFTTLHSQMKNQNQALCQATHFFFTINGLLLVWH